MECRSPAPVYPVVPHNTIRMVPEPTHSQHITIDWTDDSQADARWDKN